MDPASVSLLAAAIVVAAAIPGPTMLTVTARVLATGCRGNLAFALGLVLGDLLWLAGALFGLAALAAGVHGLAVGLKYLGAAYLLYLAYRFWHAPAPAAEAAMPAPPERWSAGVLGGLAVAAANPKTMMFYLALVPNLVPLHTLDTAAFLGLSAVVVAAYGPVLAAYMLAAGQARRLLVSPATHRAVSRGSSMVMAGTAALVVARS